MAKHLPKFLIGALALLSDMFLMGQSSYQLTLDTAAQADRSAILPDGSIVLAMRGSDKNVIWIADPAGTAQSSFSVPASIVPEAFSICANPGGGLYIASIAALSTLDVDPFTLDTFAIMVRIISASPTGQVHFSRDIALVTTVFEDISDLTERFHLVADTTGVFVSLSDGLSFVEQYWYIKMSPAGDLLWCEHQEGMFAEPGVPQIDISPSGDGGMYFAVTDIAGSTTSMKLGRLGAQGGLMWIEQFTYLNNSNTLEVNDIITTSAGVPLAAGSVAGVGFSYGYLLSPTADGSGAVAHFYDLPVGVDKEFRSVSESPNGDLFMMTRGEWDPGENLGILHLGSDMNVVSALRTEVTPSGQNDHWFRPEIIAHRDGQVLLPGSLKSVDQIFGYIQYQPSVWNIDLAATSSCMVSEVTVPHYVVPDSLLAIEPISDFTLIPSAPLVVNGPLSTTPETPVMTSDLCQQLVSVPERMAVVDPIIAYPNPSEAGSTLNIQCQGAVRFALFNATGALVRNIPGASGSNRNSLDCSGLAAGLYSVVAFGKDGQRLAATKVELR